MTIAERLNNIARMAREGKKVGQDKAMDKAVDEMLDIAIEHPEGEMLLSCTEQAEYGRTTLDMGRTTLAPESLLKEGLWVGVNGWGFCLHFDKKPESSTAAEPATVTV